MSRSNIVGTHKTNVSRMNGILSVTYHNTAVVVAMPDGTIILNTGGWRSNTTKLRMNQAANQYGLGFGVYQEKGGWFVRLRDAEKFEDRTVLPFDDRTITFKSGSDL